MKCLFYLALAVVLTACGAQEPPPQRFTLADFHGKWLVINYWAKWCKPCAEEIPELNALDQQYPLVTVVGVNYDGVTGTELEQHEEKLDVEFATLEFDPAVQLGVPRPLVLPTTLVIDPEGKLITTLVGPQTLQSLARITGQEPAN